MKKSNKERKMEICEFLKENIDSPVHRNVLRYICNTLTHEELHCKIYRIF